MCLNLVNVYFIWRSKCCLIARNIQDCQVLFHYNVYDILPKTLSSFDLLKHQVSTFYNKNVLVFCLLDTLYAYTVNENYYVWCSNCNWYYFNDKVLQIRQARFRLCTNCLESIPNSYIYSKRCYVHNPSFQ